MARVADAFGNPVANVMVTFFAPIGPLGGTFAPAASPTRVVLIDTNGIATAPGFTASGMAGMYTVIARAEGVVSSTATFALTNGVVNNSPPPRVEPTPLPMPMPVSPLPLPREAAPMPPGAAPNPRAPRR